MATIKIGNYEIPSLLLWGDEGMQARQATDDLVRLKLQKVGLLKNKLAGLEGASDVFAAMSEIDEIKKNLSEKQTELDLLKAEVEKNTTIDEATLAKIEQAEANLTKRADELQKKALEIFGDEDSMRKLQQITNSLYKIDLEEHKIIKELDELYWRQRKEALRFICSALEPQLDYEKVTGRGEFALSISQQDELIAKVTEEPENNFETTFFRSTGKGSK